MSRKNSHWRTITPELMDSLRRYQAESEYLHFNTVSPLLVAVLKKLMKLPELDEFRIWGPTCVCLRKGQGTGHNIDLVALLSRFVYASPRVPVDFDSIDRVLDRSFDYCCRVAANPPVQRSYLLGISETENVEVNLSTTGYLDPKLDTWRGIRLATNDDLRAQSKSSIVCNQQKSDSSQ